MAFRIVLLAALNIGFCSFLAGVELLLLAQNHRVGRLNMTVIIEGTTDICNPHFCFRRQNDVQHCPPNRGFLTHLRHGFNVVNGTFGKGIWSQHKGL